MTKNQIKWAFLAVLFIAAVVGGFYLSGWILLFWLKLGKVPLEWDTYYKYFKAMSTPRVMPFATPIKVSGIVGFGLPLAGYVAGLIGAFKSKPQSTHGDSRFASASDLADKGMFKPSSRGLIVGKMNNKLIRLDGQQFVILAAPTRSGKGVGIVIPNLLDYQESMVVLDIKQENFQLTSGWRKSQGQAVFLFNPFAEDGRTHRWNPLTYVSSNKMFRVSDIMSISAMLYPDGSADQKFWVSQSRNAFLAFAMYLFERHEKMSKSKFKKKAALRKPTLGEIYRLSSGDGSDLKQYLQGLSQEDFLSCDTQTAFANLLSQADDTFSSIMGSFKEPLNAWINPVVDAATSEDDFSLNDLRKKKMTIYVGIQPNKLAESRLIVNLFFSQIINLNTKELPQNNSELQFQCVLLMDEFTSIGKVDIIASAVSYMAGYNIRLLPIIQSMAQLDATYGKEVARTLITNHALQIVYAPREQQDANDYSEMLGYTTVTKRNTTRGRDVSYSEVEEKRALMLPQELKAIGFDKEIFFYEGVPHPVLCDKIKYYEDKYFTQRLIPAVDVVVLKF
ncbi:MAG: type IV secretory system conjugative DNA transfer family protein [Formosimonas sp.]